MIEIIPAIMPKGLRSLETDLGVVAGAAPLAQLDLMDGKFVPELTWPFSGKYPEDIERIRSEEIGMPYWDEVDLELDLMVAPENIDMDTILALGPKRLIFHREAWKTKESFFEYIDTLDPYIKASIEIGIAIGTTTPIEEISPLPEGVAFVQCMGIERIGYQGNPFDARVLEQIARVKEAFPGVFVSVDGGVNLETAPDLLDAGADRLVIGSAIFRATSPRDAIASFRYLAGNAQ